MSEHRKVRHVPPTRAPRHGFGVSLRSRLLGFVGRVDAIYADYHAAEDGRAVVPGWFEMQERKPKTRDQVFYSLIALDGRGAVLAGESDVELA